MRVWPSGSPLLVVLAAGWKGGPIFPLMFIAGALAMAAGDAFGFDGVIIYAGAVAGVVTGALRSIPLGVIVALLVVPSALLVPLIVGGAAAGLVLRIHREPQTAPKSPR